MSVNVWPGDELIKEFDPKLRVDLLEGLVARLLNVPAMTADKVHSWRLTCRNIIRVTIWAPVSQAHQAHFQRDHYH